MNEWPPRMLLSVLLDGIIAVADDLDRKINDLVIDSRAVTPGACFVALRGASDDGLAFAADAQSRGAVAVLSETDSNTQLTIPVCVVPELRNILGRLANRFFDRPSADVAVHAVTGTNGKTTVTWMLSQALNALRQRCGYIGTLGIGVIDALRSHAHTTPDVLSLHRELGQLRAAGVAHCALEASSHALAQGRLDGLSLSSAAFTNLSRDHLDYHSSQDAYAEAKALLFTHDHDAHLIFNYDDEFGRELARRHAVERSVWTCSSRDKQATVSVRAIEMSAQGCRFELHAGTHSATLQTRLIGRFNVDNIALVCAILLANRFAFEDICAVIEHLSAPPGRMSFCGTNASGAGIYVDYAHTPDALARALSALRELEPAGVTVVFGCGGDRDQGKRAAMGAVAEQFAGRLILTSDNPRSEDPEQIVAGIKAGISAAAQCHVELDRKRAIQLAVELAAANELVLIAGKGHETTQQIKNTTLPFNDCELVKQLLAGAA